MELPTTVSRVSRHTPSHVNRAVERVTECSLMYYGIHQNEIPQRLDELDREWDIERILETNASSLILAGLALGLGLSRKFFLLPALVSSFLLQHALQGWCPPVSILRRMGFRTQSEIEHERHALLAMQERSISAP